MIKYFKTFENNINDIYKDIVDDYKKDDIKKFVGFDFPYEFEIDESTFNKNDANFTIYLKDEDFSDFVNIEDGTLKFTLSLNNYGNNYYYDVDISEIDYLHYYLNEDSEELLKEVIKYFDVNVGSSYIDYENLSYFFEFLDKTEFFDKDLILYEISIQITNAVEKNAKDILKRLPFNVSIEYSPKWDLEFNFNIYDMLDYIEEKKLKDINSISDFIENVDFSDWSDWSTIETNYTEFNYEFDYKDLNSEFKKQIEKIISEFGENTTNFVDPNQLNLFTGEEEKTTKKSKNYTFEYKIFKNFPFNNSFIYKAKVLGGKILAWYFTYEFQKNFISKEKKEEDKLKKYKGIESENMLHPDIVKEYEHLKSSSVFNI